MKSRLSALPVLAAFLICFPNRTAQSAPDDLPPSDSFYIVALGDSITRGARPAKGAIQAVLPEETFCSLLSEQLQTLGYKAKIINAGVPSNRTDQGLLRLQNDVLNHRPSVVLIMYGTNDSCYDKNRTVPRLSLDEYKRNLEALIAKIRKAGAVPIIMTPPPLKEGWGAPRNKIYLENGANAAILPYVEACRDISSIQRTPLIDHFAIWQMKGADYIKSLLPDGCHPNAEGHKALAAEILPVLLEQLPPSPAKALNTETLSK